MLSIEFLPATYGDCIWIEYGDAAKPTRILIDGGTAGTREILKARIAALSPDDRHFELVVVSHIDRDHIEGMLAWLEEGHPGITMGDFWFNGWPQLENLGAIEHFGAVQGERLGGKLQEYQFPWNTLFSEKAIMIPAQGDLPEITLPGGMKLTLLSPNLNKLLRLKKQWEKTIKDAGLEPGFGLENPDQPLPEGLEEFGEDGTPDLDTLAKTPFKEDTASPNGSSLAFLAEFEGKRLLLTGDAHPTLVLNSLTRLFGEGKVPVDLFKLSHHGSEKNTSPDLIRKLACENFVFSTNGAIYRHPSHTAIAWVVKNNSNPNLLFNYRSEANAIWEDDVLRMLHGYEVRYPEDSAEGLKIVF